MNQKTRREAEAAAGYREKYAMKNGKETRRTQNGETLYIFKYSATEEYQDANGATYNATRRAWIG